MLFWIITTIVFFLSTAVFICLWGCRGIDLGSAIERRDKAEHEVWQMNGTITRLEAERDRLGADLTVATCRLERFVRQTVTALRDAGCVTKKEEIKS